MNVLAPPPALPRGTYTGNPIVAPRAGRRFYQCPICGGWVDSNDAAQVAEHEGGLPVAAETALPDAAPAA